MAVIVPNTYSEAAVRFSNVGKQIPAKEGVLRILDGVDGQIPSGSVVTLVGPSGSGKSTLLSMCNLMQTPDEGEIFVGAKEIRQWAVPELRRHVGMVFQSATMLPGTVYNNLVIAAELCGKTLNNPSDYLESVGLTQDFLYREAQDLSGGQKQRVALARTLVTNPSILLLDEATSALDPASARQVEELICTLNRQHGLTVIWVTHQLDQARRVGDLTWLMVNGRLVETGETSDLFENPRTETARLFINGQLSGGGVE